MYHYYLQVCLSKSLYFQGRSLYSGSWFLSSGHCLMFWDNALGAACWEFSSLQKTPESWITRTCPINRSRFFHPSARVCSTSRCLLNPPWLLYKACIMFAIPIKKSKKKAFFFPHQTVAWRAIPHFQREMPAVRSSSAEHRVTGAAGPGTQLLGSVVQTCCNCCNVCSDVLRFLFPNSSIAPGVLFKH